MNETPSTSPGLLDRPWLEWISRLLLGGVLLTAGSLKAFDMPAMADSLMNYDLFPLAVVNLIAIVLPLLEILLGVGLIAGLFYRGSRLLASVVFAMFLFSIAYAVARGLDIDCGCFGTAKAMHVGALAILRNTFFLVCLLPLWFNRRPAWRLDRLLFKA